MFSPGACSEGLRGYVPPSPPALVSQTAFDPGAATTSWTVFSGLDLSDCSLAIVVGMVLGTNQTLILDGASSAGWTLRSGDARLISGINSAGRLRVFTQAAPTSSETLVMAPTSSANMAAILVRVNNASTVTLAYVNGPNSNSTAADPPSVTLPLTRDALWIAAMGLGAAAAPSGYPAGYSNGIARAVSAAAAGGVALASKAALSATSEDPGVFTNASARWGALTIGCTR